MMVKRPEVDHLIHEIRERRYPSKHRTPRKCVNDRTVKNRTGGIERGNNMGKVIVGTTMSLDGFMNDRNGDVSLLYPDLEALRRTEMLQEEIQTTGAVLMGKRAYDMAEGDFTDYEFQVPIFVLTHHVPEKVAKGENERLTFTFVTDGIESAIEQARSAAGDKHVIVIGGANTAQQCIRAGLVDQIQIGIVPILLGEGLRFFEHIGRQIELERMTVIESPGRLDLRFRVVKDGENRR
jgi:dihydrofolate reductase